MSSRYAPLMKRFTLLALLATGTAFAADWPHWRGPSFNGISAESDWKSEWSGDGPKVLWKANVGIGFASFTVANGKVYTTGNADNTDTVYCFDATSGKEIWKHSYPADLGDKYYEGGTSGTPTIDGDRVYQLSRWGDTFCFDAATGKVLWTKNVQKETEAGIPDWGFGGSVLVQGDLLILNVGVSGLALEKATGKIVWKSETDNAGYSTPLPYKHGNESLAILGSGKSFVAVNVKTGAKVWEFPWNTRYGVNASDPVISGDQVFIASGYNKGCALVKLDGNTPVAVWQKKDMRTQMNPCVLLNGHLYGIDGDENSRASLKCLDLATGTVKWEDKSVGFGSVTAADGKLLVMTSKGELITAKASADSFDVISRAQVLSGKCWTVPVLANGRIYCRNAAGDVVCLDVRTK